MGITIETFILLIKSIYFLVFIELLKLSRHRYTKVFRTLPHMRGVSYHAVHRRKLEVSPS